MANYSSLCSTGKGHRTVVMDAEIGFDHLRGVMSRYAKGHPGIALLLFQSALWSSEGNSRKTDRPHLRRCPDPTWTPQILDVLKNTCSAAFFVVGNRRERQSRSGAPDVDEAMKSAIILVDPDMFNSARAPALQLSLDAAGHSGDYRPLDHLFRPLMAETWNPGQEEAGRWSLPLN